ncbi:ThuA domain-containing protein [Brachybacterium alimentarium]|uniref:ThuA domain-containing protein n=1 Tax=Brachybacterium alimentarium TaxID=47845 RepID=UPI003FD6BD54
MTDPQTTPQAAPQAGASGQGSPTTRTVLVVRGGWDGHQPIEATDLFIPFLEENGFSVRIEESPAVYADAEYMATVDLIVQCNTMSTIEKEEFEGLRDAVEAGTGLAGWHGGIADSYRNNSDYLTLIGGQFGCHPGKHPDERTGEQSDNYVPYTVDMLPAAAEHPITRGIGDFDLVTEQYWVLSDDYIDVLATTTQKVRAWDPWHRPITSPAIWTRQWGEGRIFVSTPGHRVEVLEDPNVRTVIERGMLWAARGSEQPYGEHGGRSAKEATR